MIPGGVLQISSDRDDQRIFWGWLDLSRVFLGIQSNLKIRGSAHVSRRCSSANKVQPNLFCTCLFGPGIFWGFVGSPRDFLGF